MTCPMTQRRTTPATCLTCPHFGGFQGGVICYQANRRIPYDPALQAIMAADSGHNTHRRGDKQVGRWQKQAS